MTETTSGIWIQGAGELASGVALRLARCGYPIVAAEIANPLARIEFASGTLEANP